jgi:ferredoxin
MVPAERNVTVASATARRRRATSTPGCAARPTSRAAKHRLVAFEKLNTWYYADAPKTVRPMLDIIRRQSTFEEVQGGLDESNALFEARRCLSCGNCFECDNCYGVCPDNAVIKLGPASASSSTTTTARAAACASPSAPADREIGRREVDHGDEIGQPGDRVPTSRRDLTDAYASVPGRLSHQVGEFGVSLSDGASLTGDRGRITHEHHCETWVRGAVKVGIPEDRIGRIVVRVTGVCVAKRRTRAGGAGRGPTVGEPPIQQCDGCGGS